MKKAVFAMLLGVGFMSAGCASKKPGYVHNEYESEKRPGYSRSESSTERVTVADNSNLGASSSGRGR